MWNRPPTAFGNLAPSGYTLTYTYDSVGNPSSLVAAPAGGGPAVLSQSYTYDNRNRVSTISGNGKTTTFTYDAVGRRTGATWPNSSTATYTYDVANQLLSLGHKTSGNSPLASFAYAYDLAGNRTSMTTLEGVNSYSYNSNNWLVAVTYPDARTQQFTYDAVGDRTQLVDSGTGVSPVSYSYGPANRLLSSVAPGETNTYVYDAAGRLTSQTVNGQSRSYAYSYRSQMTGLTDTNAATGAYDFDADGNRISMIPVGTAGPAVRMVYDGPNAILDIESGLVKAAYVHGLAIDQPIERIQFIGGVSDGRHVYHTDALGSIWGMTDDLQSVAKSYTYTARETLGDSAGLYYYRWRVMEPKVGRFTSEDPVRFRAGPNLYLYVLNNPLTYSDPKGLLPAYPCLICGCCGAALTLNCTGICTTGYWDDPDETFPECFWKCMEAGAQAGWISVGCWGHCVACGFVQ